MSGLAAVSFCSRGKGVGNRSPNAVALGPISHFLQADVAGSLARTRDGNSAERVGHGTAVDERPVGLQRRVKAQSCLDVCHGHAACTGPAGFATRCREDCQVQIGDELLLLMAVHGQLRA